MPRRAHVKGVNRLRCHEMATRSAAALPLLIATDVSGTPLAAYASYYRALALAGLNRVGEATELLDRIEQSSPGQRGYLFDEAIPIKRADFDVARLDARDAVDTLEGLSKEKFLTSPEDVCWFC